MTGSESPPEKVEEAMANMERCLDSIETLWLSQGKYIVGDEITVADLFAACEIEQPSKYNAMLFCFIMFSFVYYKKRNGGI